jgi:hypothetical protein
MEVNAEVAAISQSVRRAFAEQREQPPSNQQPSSQQPENRATERKPSRVHPLLTRDRPSMRAERPSIETAIGDSMGRNTQQLLLAEANTHSSKLDDQSKTNPRSNSAGALVAAMSAEAVCEQMSGGAAAALASGPASYTGSAPSQPDGTPSQSDGAAAQPGGRKTAAAAKQAPTGARRTAERKSAPKKGTATMVYPGDGVYEGEYVDGKKAGKGKYWYVNGTMYEGAWRDDVKHGHGKEIYADGATYEGSWADGARHGFGTLTYANNDVYEVRSAHRRPAACESRVCEWRVCECRMWRWCACGGKWTAAAHIQGLCGAAGAVDGPVRDGWEWGLRRLSNEHGCDERLPVATLDASSYVHAFPACGLTARMVHRGARLARAQGEWLEDVKNGMGTFRWAAGTVYEGSWTDGVMHGQGTYHFIDGCTYQGAYADGKRNGRGVYRFVDGSFFEGEYHEGVVDGRGTFTFADGSAEVGRWEEGRPVGEATRFSPDHRAAWRLFDGEVTGPVSLDLADVIAQMAFRPKAARLARAVRDQIATVTLEEERKRFASPAPSTRHPQTMNERPPWQGVLEVTKRAPSPSGSPLASPASSSPANSPPASPEPPVTLPDGKYPTCHTPGFLAAAAASTRPAPSSSRKEGLLRHVLPKRATAPRGPGARARGADGAACMC